MMKSRSDGPEIDEDGLLADVMDEYLTDDEQPAVRFIAVTNNGKTYKVRVEQKLIWFPSLRMKGRPKQ
jgi:hypothetical protein